jgi:ABC-type phosphate transport system ATPase subunit
MCDGEPPALVYWLTPAGSACTGVLDRYERVLDACALRADLATFPSGDMTVVSGTSLSGGQRQRVSVARAAYSSAEVWASGIIGMEWMPTRLCRGGLDWLAASPLCCHPQTVLLDDPLSALDYRVSALVCGPRMPCAWP